MSGADALGLATAGARSVRVTRVGEFDPRSRGRTKAIALETGAEAIQALRDALAIDEQSLRDEHMWMTTGIVDLHFLDGHSLLTTVTYLAPEWLRWRPWRFDARLRAPALLAQWLEARAVP